MTNILNAQELRKKIALAQSEKASAAMKAHEAAMAEKDAFLARISKPSGLTDEQVLEKAGHIVERAVSNGLTSVQIFRFPNNLCTDGGRAIDQGDCRCQSRSERCDHRGAVGIDAPLQREAQRLRDFAREVGGDAAHDGRRAGARRLGAQVKRRDCAGHGAHDEFPLRRRRNVAACDEERAENETRAAQEVDCEIESIERVIDSSTLETVSRRRRQCSRRRNLYELWRAVATASKIGFVDGYCCAKLA